MHSFPKKKKKKILERFNSLKPLLMSFFMDDHDEFDDDWDDFTPSVQDTLYENLETIENNAAAKLEVCETNLKLFFSSLRICFN